MCLDKLEEDGHKTVAIPTLGVGDFKYPVRMSAATIVSAIKDFCRANQCSDISTIIIVVDIVDYDFSNIWKVRVLFICKFSSILDVCSVAKFLYMYIMISLCVKFLTV